MSASVNSTYSHSPAAATPCAIAQTFPAHPSASGRPAITFSTAPAVCPSDSATPAVPSELPSSTSTTENSPGYPCPSKLGSVNGNTAASSRAGTTATTEGHPPATPPPPPPPPPPRPPHPPPPPRPTP